MRVALVVSSFLPRFGGVEEHVLNVARALAKAGHRVAIWAVDQGDDDVPDQIDGIAVRYLPCPMPNRSMAGALRYLRARGPARRAWRRAYRVDLPDVLHVHCYGPNGFHALGLAGSLFVPVVLSSHGETFMDADGVFDRPGLLPHSLRHALRRARTVRIVTGCSGYVLADLERRFGLLPRMGIVVPNGVDLDEPAGPPPAGLPPDYLLAAGRMVPVKGFDLLLAAYARAFGAVPPPQGPPGEQSARDEPVPALTGDVAHRPALVLAGDGPHRPALERLAGRLGLADRVVFTGRLARPQLVAAMAGARALVVPSRVEAFGVVVLEGWRAGVPVVVTDRGGPAEFVRDEETGLLVDPRDPAALADALRRATHDPAFVEIGAAGRAEALHYTWDRVAGAYADLYASARRPRVTRRRTFGRRLR